MDWKTALTEFLLPAVVAGVSLVVTLLVNQAKTYIKRQNKSQLHWVAADIVVDAVSAVLPDFLAAIRDGEISKDEKNLLKKKAREIAEPRLQDLSGFASKKLGQWLEHEMDIALGKLLFAGSDRSRPVDTRTIGPDDVAVK